MGYYVDILFKSSYDVYQEFIDYTVDFSTTWKHRQYLQTENVDRKFVEDLLEGSVYFDGCDVCIKDTVKYGTLIFSALSEFSNELSRSNRDDEFTFAEAGEEYDDYGVRGDFDMDVDVYVYKEIEPALSKPKKLKKGTLFIQIKK